MRMTHRHFPAPRSLVLAAALVWSAGALARADEEAVTVEKQQPKVEYKSFDPKAPPADMPPLTPHEAGVTVSRFGCASAVRGTVVNQTQADGAATADVRVDGVQVTLTLGITVWVASDAPRKTHDHEAGHRDISLRFYADADKSAAAVARGLAGTTVTGKGTTPHDAADAALSAAANDVNERCMAQVNAPCQKVQEIYDRLTRHGTNDLPEAEAIRNAAAEAKGADGEGKKE